MTLPPSLQERLGLRIPLIQAPMAGGGDTPAMGLAVANAGGVGFLGCAYRDAATIAADAQTIRRGGNGCFGINLFAPRPCPASPDVAPALRFIAPYYAELGLPPPVDPSTKTTALDFDRQVAAMLDSGARVFSFTMGVMPAHIIAAAKARSMLVIGTATTVAEAITLEQAGVDAVIAQGMEAGGHRGSFDNIAAATMIGTIALVPQIVDAINIPVIAAGGLGDGRGLAAALALGAELVQIGTAFLACAESGIPRVYKQAMARAGISDTAITTAFSGRPARGISNRLMRAASKAGAEAILPFPLQNDLTRSLRQAAARQEKAEYLSLWCGQGVGMIKAEAEPPTIAACIKTMMDQARKAHHRLSLL